MTPLEGHTIKQYKTLYRIDGRRYDRMSDILTVYPKGGLDKWQRKHGFEEADRLRDEAARFGKVVHGVVEALNKNESPNVITLIMEHDPFLTGDDALLTEYIDEYVARVEPYIDTYADWMRENVERVLFVEQCVWSDLLGWAGTDDMVFIMKDWRVLVGDLKTSKSLSPSYRLQTAGYAEAFLEHEWLERYDGRAIIHMPSNGKGLLRVKEYDEHEADYAAFRAAHVVYRHEKAHADDWKR